MRDRKKGGHFFVLVPFFWASFFCSLAAGPALVSDLPSPRSPLHSAAPLLLAPRPPTDRARRVVQGKDEGESELEREGKDCVVKLGEQRKPKTTRHHEIQSTQDSEDEEKPAIDRLRNPDERADLFRLLPDTSGQGPPARKRSHTKKDIRKEARRTIWPSLAGQESKGHETGTDGPRDRRLCCTRASGLPPEHVSSCVLSCPMSCPPSCLCSPH